MGKPANPASDAVASTPHNQPAAVALSALDRAVLSALRDFFDQAGQDAAAVAETVFADYGHDVLSVLLDLDDEDAEPNAHGMILDALDAAIDGAA